MATPEGRVKRKVSAALKQLPACYRFMPVQQGLGASTLDYLCCVAGQFVAVETKAPGRQLTPRQAIVADEIRKAGGLVFVVDGETSLHNMIAYLQR